MGRRSEHSLEHIKQMAIEAAEKLVAAGGTKDLTTRKVAKEIGYTSGSLYMVFKNVDDLILQINGRTLDRMRIGMEAVAAKEPDPAKAVRKLCLEYLNFAGDNPHLWELVFENRWRQGFARPAWYQAKKLACFQPLEQALRKMDSGRPEDEVSIAAASLWSAIHGINALHATGKLEAAVTSPVKRLAEFQIENFLRGFLKK